MIRPDFEEAKRLSKDHTVLPIALEVLSDSKTPIEVLRILRRESRHCFILESVGGSDSWGRYTFLGYKPVMNVYGQDGCVTIKDSLREVSEERAAPEVLREIIDTYKSPRISYLPPFTGGFVGYFAYDFVRYFIPGLNLNAVSDEGFRDFHLMLIDKVIAFDHFKQKIFIIANICAENIEESYIKGVTELKDIERLILDRSSHPEEELSSCGEFAALHSPDEFTAMVGRVKEHIFEGDIFQAVISNRFKAPFSGSLMSTYRLLRTINPSPYMAFMRFDDMEIACASPETLIALRDGKASSFPLAGTCPRGTDETEDAALIEALLSDEKELSEHDMLVDLSRNDIGKISKFGSVAVSEYRQIKRFSHVSHISSHVTGEIREGVKALDAIAATLPAGTLSGAPKKRACEIIDDVEGVKRGPYGGAMGYIDFAGNMDMCIAIRMATLKDGFVYVQSGAGVVADSVPEKEYRETQNKARAVMEALKKSGEVR